VAPVPGSSFFPQPEHRFVRLNFAKSAATLREAGERLQRLRRLRRGAETTFNIQH
jgi:aminotransferase